MVIRIVCVAKWAAKLRNIFELTKFSKEIKGNIDKSGGNDGFRGFKVSGGGAAGFRGFKSFKGDISR